ncbi:MAG: hypothetical protein IT534_10340 [Bauldia sp.]|nr:hypothetical protein [Bauldia sp.]
MVPDDEPRSVAPAVAVEERIKAILEQKRISDEAAEEARRVQRAAEDERHRIRQAAVEAWQQKGSVTLEAAVRSLNQALAARRIQLVLEKSSGNYPASVAAVGVRVRVDERVAAPGGDIIVLGTGAISIRLGAVPQNLPSVGAFTDTAAKHALLTFVEYVMHNIKPEG